MSKMGHFDQKVGFLGGTATASQKRQGKQMVTSRITNEKNILVTCFIEFKKNSLLSDIAHYYVLKVRKVIEKSTG